MSLLFRTHLKLAKASIKNNRGRSFLTCLGIAIGVASIVLILSLMGSISNLIKDEIAEIGSDLIVVRPVSSKNAVTDIVKEFTSINSFEQSSLSLSDVDAISKIQGVDNVAPIALATSTISSEKNNLSAVQTLGTTADFTKIEPLALKYGSFMTEYSTEKTVVLGYTLSLELFNTVNSTIGRTVEVMGEKYIVIGVLEKIDKTINFDNIDLDNTLIMDISTLNALHGSVQIQQINIKAENTDSLQTVSKYIESTLAEKKFSDKTFSVAYGDAISHPASSMFNMVSGILTIVAAISLIVGGIGVMNIMLVSVAERTHEIGIRKAVGASSANILSQFLFESLILSFLGGILGLILGYVLALAISALTSFAPFISWQIIIITFLVTVVIGILFGIYPALKAALHNPIDSLKHYR